jgi:DNA-directed RNA polymerase specialized sigma24 family protein
VSVTTAIDAFDSLADPFALLQASSRARLRKAIIEKALTAETSKDEAPGSLGSDEARLDDAMLHLDLFSRRIFVLTVLEGYSFRETSRLLRCDVGTVTEMRSAALSNLASVLTVRGDGVELHSNESGVTLFAG